MVKIITGSGVLQWSSMIMLSENFNHGTKYLEKFLAVLMDNTSLHSLQFHAEVTFCIFFNRTRFYC